MSAEQFTPPPSSEQLPSSGATRFGNLDEIHLHMSNYAPIEDARAAIRAAIASAQTNSLEKVIKDDVETLHLAKIRTVRENSDMVEGSRIAYGQDNFDLTGDEEPKQDMFGQAA